MHALTAEGEQALREWITAPVRSTREIRLDFLVKLYLARQIAPDAAAGLVREQRAALAQRATRLEKQLADPQPEDAGSTFGESVLRLRLTQTQAAVAWLATLPELQW